MEYGAIKELCQSRGYPFDSILGRMRTISLRRLFLELYKEWYVHGQIGLLGGKNVLSIEAEGCTPKRVSQSSTENMPSYMAYDCR